MANSQHLLTNDLQLFDCQVFLASGNSYQSQNYNLLRYFQISEMNNKENKADSQAKQKFKKDYLYRIAKIKQNNLLHEKNINQEFEQEILQQNQHNKNNYEEQQQFDFELNLPLPQRPTEKKAQKNQLNHINNNLKIIEHKKQNEDKNNQSQQFENVKFEQSEIIKNQKSEVKEFKNNRQNKYDKQREEIKKQQNAIQIKPTILHQPFIFDDFEDEEQEQEQQNGEKHEQDETHNNKHISISQQQSPTQSNESQRQIKGLTITSSVLEGNVMIKITNKIELIMSRLPPGIILKCIIRRPSDIFNPEFDFYINNGMKHLISAKKYSFAKKQIFNLSLELGKYRANDIVGTIMANTVHSTYWLYKQETGQQSPNYEIKTIIKYAKVVKPNFRQMSVHLFTDPNKCLKVEQTNLGHECSKQADLILRNNYDEQKQSSSKNFCLFDLEDNQYQYLKMKKVSDNMFEVEIQHPLSPFQAFAIALTRFDAQLK